MLHSQRAYSKEVGLKTDNDLYTSTYYDRYYTNGTFLYFRYLSKNTNIKKIHEFELGQKMYTPKFSSSLNKEDIDRPYAGYSYLKYSLKYFSKKNYALKSSFELGILGSNSKAQEIQDVIHEIYGFPSTIGWEYQIENTLGINMELEFSKPFSKKEKKTFDFTSISSLQLGTIYTQLTTNVMSRINLLKKTLNSYNNSTLFESNLNHINGIQQNELFLYFKPQIGYALYNATIQGSMFHNESPVTYGIKGFIYEFELGIKFAIQRFDLSYSFIKYSKTTEKIENNTSNYGSITINYKFN